MTPADNQPSSTASVLQQLIYNNTEQNTNLTVCTTVGDGNCLFRAISLALTNSQDHHNFFREKITDHMLDEAVRHNMESMFSDSETYSKHVQQMKQNGTWGTEQEIIAAAHLFNCSIICLAKDNDFYLQQFSPHFLTNPHCNSSCSHTIVDITNTTGAHFDHATVTLREDSDSV